MLNIKLHKKAEEYFNCKANEVLQSVITVPKNIGRSDRSDSARDASETVGNETSGARFHPHIDATVSASDIVGSLIKKQVAKTGQIVSLQIVGDKNNHCLTDANACDVLTKLIDGFWRKDDIAEYVKRDFLIDSFLKWVDSRRTEQYVEFTTDLIQAAVKDTVIIVPLHQFVVKTTMSFGALHCVLRPMLNREVEDHIENCSNETEKKVRRKKFQATCVVECKVQAEFSRAIEIALSRANVVSEIFSFYSPFALIPGERFNGVHAGSEYTPSYDVLTQLNSGKFSLSSGILPTFDARHHIVEKEDLKAMEESGIKGLCNLLCNQSPSDFEEKVRSSVRIFIKNAFTGSSTEKLIFAVVSLESLMLKNQTESIVQNVSERVAFLLASDIHSRKECIQIVKDAYSMRSAYMHHGRTAEDNNAIMEFLMTVFATITAVLNRLAEFNTKDEFLNHIDEVRLT